MESQVISKKRLVEHGEVLTGKREVNAMLDLVKQETQRIESRFLEPACGTGNFVAEIFERKLRVVEARYRKSQLEFERYSILAVSSIYGIDILEDNVQQCRQRLFEWNLQRNQGKPCGLLTCWLQRLREHECHQKQMRIYYATRQLPL